MNFSYEYGPNVDFNIKLTGTMKEFNGNYSDLKDDDKYLVQLLCHIVYQAKENIKSVTTEGFFEVDKIWFHWIHTSDGEDYSVYTKKDMMTALHIIETGYYSFDVEFLSPKYCYDIESLLNIDSNNLICC